MAFTKVGSNKKNNELDGEDSGNGGSSTPEVAAMINTGLYLRGFKLLPATEGKLIAGHQPYILVSLEANPDVKVWRRLRGVLEVQSFYNNFTEVVNKLISNDDNHTEIAKKISSAVLEQGKCKNTAFYNHGQTQADYVTDTGSRSFLGTQGVRTHKQIPMRSWFPALTDLDPLELLTLFPKAEAEAMMLMLGRVVLGVGGTVTNEGTIEHRMRAAAIVVGLEPGLGKSTFLGYLTTALEDLGYTATPISTPGARFGWGKIAEADLAYKDDLTSDGQAKLLKADVLKTIITGGKFSTESKGVNATETQSKATVIAFTNVYKKNHFYSMDEGSIDRFNFLHTYDSEELAQHHPNIDARTEPNYQRLSQKYNVSINQLTTYLLACCAEKLLSVIGMELKDEQLLRVSKCTLEDTFNGLQQRFFYKPFVSHTKTLVKSVVQLCALAVAHAARDDEEAAALMVNNLTKSSFSLDLLTIAAMNFATSETNELYDFPNVRKECKYPIKAHELDKLTQVKNTAGAFAVVTGELQTNDGFNYPTTPGIYDEIWKSEVKQINALILGHKDRSWKLANTLKESMGKICTLALTA